VLGFSLTHFLNSGARYFVQSSVSTFANLSIPKRIGATVNAIRSSRKACATGSPRSVVEVGTGVGRRAAPMAVVMVLLLGGSDRCARVSAAPGASLTPRAAYASPRNDLASQAAPARLGGGARDRGRRVWQ
jgi:hypothetical protein